MRLGSGPGSSRSPKGRRHLATALLIGCLLAPSFALAKDRMATYDSTDAANPVRVVAYILHPVGVLLDSLIVKPAYWLGTHEPLKTLFGVTD